MKQGPLHGREAVLRSVLNVVVPEAAELSESAWRDGLAIIEGVVGERPAGLQRQLRVFLALLEQSARARYGAPFSALPPARQTTWLRSFEHSRVPLLRKGFWGVRTLALMGYYARPEAGEAIGYRAHAGGWSARKAAP